MTGLILAVDTAFDRCSACIFDPTSSRCLAREEPVIGKGHAERLVGVVEGVLAEAEARYADLGKLAVTVGPGSFTGVRVGVAAVRGWALALGIPAVGISTLEAMAASAPLDRSTASTILAILDAKRNEVHAAIFASDGTTLSAATALRPDGLSAFVGSRTERLSIVGSGGAIAAGVLGLASEAIVVPQAYVDVAVLAGLSVEREPDGPPVPLYLREPDAKLPVNATRVSFVVETTPQGVGG